MNSTRRGHVAVGLSETHHPSVAGSAKKNKVGPVGRFVVTSKAFGVRFPLPDLGDPMPAFCVPALQ